MSNHVIELGASERVLNQLDHTRLSRWLELKGDLDSVLNDTLDLSDLLDPREMPPNVVTMNSRVLLQEQGRDAPHELTLSYPDEARADEGKVSVLSPVGASLLGAQVGWTVHWVLPGGQARQAAVLALPYQPEAAGDYLR